MYIQTLLSGQGTAPLQAGRAEVATRPGTRPGTQPGPGGYPPAAAHPPPPAAGLHWRPTAAPPPAAPPPAAAGLRQQQQASASSSRPPPAAILPSSSLPATAAASSPSSAAPSTVTKHLYSASSRCGASASRQRRQPAIPPSPRATRPRPCIQTDSGEGPSRSRTAKAQVGSGKGGEGPELPSAKVHSHPAAPAGVEADSLDSVLASTTARSKKKGRRPGAAEATQRIKAPREPRIDGDAARKQAQQDSERKA
jgi:hypothetical protein